MNHSLILGLSLCVALILVVGFFAATSRRRPDGTRNSDSGGDPGGYWSDFGGHGHGDGGSSDGGGGDGGGH